MPWTPQEASYEQDDITDVFEEVHAIFKEELNTILEQDLGEMAQILTN